MYYPLFLGIHIASAGLWLGCVLTETLFERALLAGARAEHRLLAELHARVDAAVEIPAFTVLLITGLPMLLQGTATGWLFAVKLLAALVAVTANVYCVYLVFCRRAAARAEDWDAFDRLDRLQHKWGAAVLLGIAVALALGLWRMAL